MSRRIPGIRRVRRSAAAVVADAGRRGAVAVVLGPVASKAELLDEFARVLEFPGWVGRNWDALADALGDLSWLPAGEKVVVWVGADVLRTRQPAAYRTALDVLRDGATRSNVSGRPLTVVLAPSAEDPEQPKGRPPGAG